jgi:MraZ protein
MLFLGEFEVKFSGQGRLSIPKKIREALGKEQLVVTKGFDRNLTGYRLNDWENGAQALLSPSIFSMDKLDLKRHLFSSASVLEIDEQGRIILPKSLLNYAELNEKTIVIIGAGTNFEIWNKNDWEAYRSKTEKTINDLAKES